MRESVAELTLLNFHAFNPVPCPRCIRENPDDGVGYKFCMCHDFMDKKSLDCILLSCLNAAGDPEEMWKPCAFVSRLYHG